MGKLPRFLCSSQRQGLYLVHDAMMEERALTLDRYDHDDWQVCKGSFSGNAGREASQEANRKARNTGHGPTKERKAGRFRA